MVTVKKRGGKIMKNLFLDAIHKKTIVVITFKSQEKGIIKRECIPFDFGPSRRAKDKSDRYHFYDLDSPDGNHTLSILENQLISLEHTKIKFDPKDYVKWTPNWFVKRNWGSYS